MDQDLNCFSSSRVCSPFMRVRITKTLTGSIDGIQLSRLSKGQVYDVYTSLACYLLSEKMAEPAPEREPTAALPIENQKPELADASRRIPLLRAIAADRTDGRSANSSLLCSARSRVCSRGWQLPGGGMMHIKIALAGPETLLGLGVWDLGFGISLKFPQLHELQRHAPSVHQ